MNSIEKYNFHKRWSYITVIGIASFFIGAYFENWLNNNQHQQKTSEKLTSIKAGDTLFLPTTRYGMNEICKYVVFKNHHKHKIFEVIQVDKKYDELIILDTDTPTYTHEYYRYNYMQEFLKDYEE
jgi:hypothetical protein